jgi:hypothetical protein
VVKIDEMPAGREMDALVAEKVMGEKLCAGVEAWAAVSGAICHGLLDGPNHINPTQPYRQDGRWTFAMVPTYSTDIAAAWQVFERLMDIADEQNGRAKRIIWNTPFCLFRGEALWYVAYDYEHCEEAGRGDTAALAICRAALKAVGVE